MHFLGSKGIYIRVFGTSLVLKATYTCVFVSGVFLCGKNTKQHEKTHPQHSIAFNKNTRIDMNTHTRVLGFLLENTYASSGFLLECQNVHTCFVIFVANSTPFTYKAGFCLLVCAVAAICTSKPVTQATSSLEILQQIAVSRRRFTISIPGSAASPDVGDAAVITGATAAWFDCWSVLLVSLLGSRVAFLCRLVSVFSGKNRGEKTKKQAVYPKLRKTHASEPKAAKDMQINTKMQTELTFKSRK